jgi:uncharacterized protein (DUF1330 family)
MSAYIVVTLTPQNVELLQEYGASAANTLTKYKGRFLAKGSTTSLHGESEHSTQAIIEFPSEELANNWYDSPEYQKLIPLRDEAMESCFQLIS